MPHPRGKATKALMTRLRIDWSAFKRASFEDRAIHGLTNGYTTEQAAQLSAMLLAGGKVLGEEGVAGGEWHFLRTRLDFLLMHSMMLRGESTRRAELPDLCAYDLPNEGSECLALILRIGRGKSIPLADGGNSRRQHYHGALRSRDVVLCPLGALAHWLVLRWDLLLEKRPDFRDRSSWYYTKVISGSLARSKEEISDKTQARWIKQALDAVGVDSSKTVHTMRQSSSRLADMWKVPADQVSSLRFMAPYTY